VRDPRGHSYGKPSPRSVWLAPERWQESEGYLHGVDLYNHGFLWEAHEAWEDLWHVSKHVSVQADYYQGLIQCAAACLKIPMGQPTGLRRLCELGTTRLERVAGAARGSFMGLDLVAFVAAMRAFASSHPDSIESRPRIELAS
jgi:hypothetical protein